MSSSQVGKTEVLLNIIGYFVHQDPSVILMLQPTERMGERFSKQRCAPMFRDSPALRGLIDLKGRSSGNTITEKAFPGGQLFINGANSPASLASMPIRVVLADEIDRYPESAGTEGDPLSLAKRRTTTFWNRKIVQTSTPTRDGLSRIQSAFNEGDQRYFEVPCPHCGKFQVLNWSNVKFDMEDGAPVLSTVVYECEKCRHPIEHIEKRGMLLKGRWKARSTARGHASFHISALYSPWTTWQDVVEEWNQARGDHERMMTWTNTILGEVFREEAREVAPSGLFSRREEYGVPDKVLFVSAAGDVQDDRLEVLAVGWGLQEESWELQSRVFWGDTSLGDVWDELEQWLRSQTFRTADGRVLGIAGFGIDSGHHANIVYAFCERVRHRTFCLKGVSGERPVVTASKTRGLQLFSVGIDPAKDIIFGRLGATTSGPVMHFSTRCDREFFEQLTAEKAVLRKKRGFDVREWVKIRPRNEILDLYVYNLATLYILNPNWEVLAENATPEARREAAKKRQNPPPKPNNWVTSWRT